MSSVYDVLESLFPNFTEVRKHRRKIRQRYRENIVEAQTDGDSTVFSINSQDYAPEYLPNWVEKKHIRANHLIEDKGRQSRPNLYRLPGEYTAEVISAMETVVWRITVRNWLSIFFEILFIGFVVLSIALAVFLGLAGVSGGISTIGNFLGNSTSSSMLFFCSGYKITSEVNVYAHLE